VPSNALFWVDAESGLAHRRQESELDELLHRADGWVWYDIAEPDEAAATTLRTSFGLHPRAVEDALERNHVSRLHAYPDCLFLVLHRPEQGMAGHVHYLEIDLFVGSRFLVTTHGPRNPVVTVESLLTETREVATRLQAGRLTVGSPMALAYAIVSALIGVEERTVNTLARDVGRLEQRVMAQQDDRRPQQFLDELFVARHALLTIRTMAAQAREVFERAARLRSERPEPDQRMLTDLADQYHRLDRITGSQLEFLQGVTDFYRARTDTRMTIAAERLAVIAAVTLPVTAISSVVGMNVIVNSRTHLGWLIVLLVAMGGLSAWLLRWARRQGWW
jgi:Mg2+ and Co2+ transporter CorA